MENQDFDKYEEIRSIASRNWLKPASVSLARLDQVKARVYNLNLTEQSKLHAHPGHISSKPALNGLASNPPLTSVPSQIHAWGSQASIPELIRKQSERQKQRPESAKPARPTRPISAKRPRPQSAKEPVTNGPTVLQVYDLNDIGSAAKPSIAVKGAKYDPTERPPEGIRTNHAASSGWVAPPGGLCDVALCDDDINAAIDGVLEEQGRPVDDEADSGIQSELGAAVEEVIRKHLSTSPTKEAPPAKGRRSRLRRPIPQPIHFSLPTATMEPEEEDGMSLDELLEATNDIDGDDDENDENDTCLGPIIWRDGDDIADEEEEGEQTYVGNVTPHDKVSATMPTGMHSDESEDEMIDLDMVDEELEEYERQRNEKRHDNKRHTGHRVKIAEERNQTVDITPRNVESAKHRTYAGRADLRNVQSRTDSGISLHSEGSKQNDNKVENRSERSKSARQKSRSRSQSPQAQSVTVAKVSVHIEDISDDENDPPGNSKSKKKRILRKTPEVETMMSHLSLSESGQGDVMETKAVSTGEKNYYDIAMTRPRSRIEGQMEEGVPRLKTVKTFQFSEEGVTEDKVVNALEVAAVPQKPLYTAPRPRSAIRPSSAAASQPPDTKAGTLKTPSGPDKQNRPASAKSGHTKPPSGAKQTHSSELNDPTMNETELAGEPERPGSRMGFSEDPDSKDVRSVSQAEPEKNLEAAGTTEPKKALPRRRIWSAPPGRIQSAPGKVQSVKQRPISASAKPNSTTSVHVVTNPKLQESRRANAAAKALKNGDVTGGSRIYDNDRFYSSYSRSAPRPVGLARQKVAAAKEVKPVEIWTRTGYCENPSEGVEDCRELQDRLLDSGLPVTLETLSRALLPPSQYCFNEYDVINPRAKPFPSNTAGLISKPMYWLPEEHKRVVEARRLVRLATQSLLEQEAEERRKMAEFEAKMSKKKRKKGKKKKGKSGKKGKKSATRVETA